MEKTIAAISTAPAPGGIGIVRLSGRKAFSIGEKVFRGVSGKALSQMEGYTAQLGAAFDAAGERLDDVVALVYRGPKSYTGEDVVELSCHGGLYMTKRLLQLVLDAGAAPAGPGEFTRRAFLNGKMDLAQAEAVMGLISASGEQARRAAEAGSTGVLSRRIAAIRGELLEQASHLAAWADFPEEDVPQVEEAALLEGIRQGEKEIVKMAFAFCLVMFIISQTVSGIFVRLFAQNPEYIALSIQSIRIYTFGIIPLALQYSFVDGLTALGIIKVSVSLSVFRKVLFLVFTLALPAFFGASSAFYAEPIVDIFCGLFSTAVFLSIIGRVLRKREQMPEGQSLYS